MFFPHSQRVAGSVPVYIQFEPDFFEPHVIFGFCLVGQTHAPTHFGDEDVDEVAMAGIGIKPVQDAGSPVQGFQGLQGLLGSLFVLFLALANKHALSEIGSRPLSFQLSGVQKESEILAKLGVLSMGKIGSGLFHVRHGCANLAQYFVLFCDQFLVGVLVGIV